jgi:hypothetical protein
MRQGLTMAPTALVMSLVLAGAGTDSKLGEVTVPDDRFGCRTAPILLLTRSDVQLELQLNSQQVAAAKAAIARLLPRALKVKGKQGTAAQDERRRIDLEMNRWLTESLSETQRERLLQVNLQWEGAAALTREHVASNLKLTDDQRGAIHGLLAQLEATRKARGTLTPAEIGRCAAQAQAELSPRQRVHWNDLLGQPCRFTIGGRVVTTRSQVDPRVLKARGRSDQ